MHGWSGTLKDWKKLKQFSTRTLDSCKRTPKAYCSNRSLRKCRTTWNHPVWDVAFLFSFQRSSFAHKDRWTHQQKPLQFDFPESNLIKLTQNSLLESWPVACSVSLISEKLSIQFVQFENIQSGCWVHFLKQPQLAKFASRAFGFSRMHLKRSNLEKLTRSKRVADQQLSVYGLKRTFCFSQPNQQTNLFTVK